MANRFLSNIRINDAYTFPASDGTNNQVIKTDGSGNLSFAQLAADSASIMYKDTFTGNGSTTAFTLANALNDEVQSNVYIDGVYQSKSTYSVSGTTLTFSTAPASGHEIEVISTTGINSGPTAIFTDTFTANGSATAFTLGQTVHDENQTIVFLNGVYQFKGTYSLSGTTLTLDTAPANGVAIEVMSIGSAYSGGDILYDHDFASAGLMTTNGSGTYSITTNNSSNWNTAYTYSQVGHLPLAGGTLTGTLTIPEYIVHSGDTDTFFGFVTNNEYKVTVDNSTKIFADADAAYLYYQGSQKIRTTNTGVTVTGNIVMGGGQIKFADNGKLMIGDSNDLQIFHNGTDSIIYNGTGAYMVRANDFRIQSSDASSTKLIVDSSGNVGINETSPSSYFSPNLVVKASADLGGVTIRSNATSHNNYLMFADGTSGNERFRGFINYDHANDKLNLAAAAGVGLTIDSSQNVGIGTTSPSKALHVVGANPTIRVEANTTNWAALEIQSADTQSTYIFMRDSGGERARIQTTSSNDLQIYTGGGGVLGIVQNSSGNVGIGTTSPAAPLQVVGTGVGSSGTIGIQGANAHVGFKNSSGTFRSWVGHFNAAGHGSDADLNLKTGYGSVGNIRFTADGDTTAAQMFLQGSTGNVGIGTAAPGQKLEVAGRIRVTTDPTLEVYEASNKRGGFQWDSTNDYVNIFSTGGDMRFDLGGERMRITSAGNVGIGRTSPVSILELGDDTPTLTISDTGNNYNNGDVQAVLHLSGRWHSGTPNPASDDYSDARMVLRKNHSDGTGGSSLAFETSAAGAGGLTEAIRIDLNQRVGIGTTSPTSTLSVKGTTNNGINVIGVGTTANRCYVGLNASNHGQLFCTGSSGQSPSLISSAGANSYISGGSVGIGTTSPETNTLLHLKKNAAASTTVELLRLDCGENSHANSKGGKIVFRDINVYDDTGTIEAVRSGGSSSSIMNFRLRNETIPTLSLSHNGSTVGIGENSASYKLRVKVGTSSADNGIYLTAGTSSSNHALYIENNAGSAEHFAVRGDGQIRMNASRAGNIMFGGVSLSGVTGSSPTGSAFGMESNGRSVLFQGTTSTAAMTMQAFYNPNGQVGRIALSGSSTAYYTSSDYRLKEDLQDFNGLDKISKIPVYDFKWKVDESRSYGVLAHELQEVIPDAVGGEKDAVNEDESINPQSVDYSKIVPILIKSIQELEARIKELENN